MLLIYAYRKCIEVMIKHQFLEIKMISIFYNIYEQHI